MSGNTIQLLQFSLEDFKEIIQETMQNALENLRLENSSNSNEEVLSRKESAKFLGVTENTLRNWEIKGTLQPNRVEGRVFYLKQDLLNLIKSEQND